MIFLRILSRWETADGQHGCSQQINFLLTSIAGIARCNPVNHAESRKLRAITESLVVDVLGDGVMIDATITQTL